MQKPWYQKVAIGVVFVLGGFVLLGTVLDAIGNAITLIPATATFGGTGVLVVGTLCLHLWLKKRPVVWVLKGSQPVRVSRLGRRPLLGLLGVIVLLWIPRIAELGRNPETVADAAGVRDSLARYSRQGVEEEGAHFRMWPVPMIDGMIEGKALRDGRYGSTPAEYREGLHAAVGDEVLVSVFFLNAGASDNATGHNARLVSRFDTGFLNEHEVSAALGIDNGMAVYSRQTGMGGILRIRSDVPTKLVYVPGSTYLCVRRPPLAMREAPAPGDPTGVCAGATDDGPVQLLRLPDGIANEVVNIGDLPGSYSGLIVFALKVEGPAAE